MRCALDELVLRAARVAKFTAHYMNERIRMAPVSLGLSKTTVDHWQTVLRLSLSASEKVVALEQAYWKGLGMVAFVATSQRTLIYPLSIKEGLGGTPGVSPHFKVGHTMLESVIEVSPRRYSLNGIELTFKRAKQAASAAASSASMAGISLTPKSPDGPKPYRIEHVGLPTDTTEAFLAKYLGVPLVLGGVLALVGFFGYLLVSWVGGLNDDDEAGPSDAHTYAIPSEMASSATGLARFTDDVAGTGVQALGSASFESLGSAICNDLATSTNDRVVVEALADKISTTLEKTHYVVLSAEYNLCR